jgi:hypothetical protein
MGFTNLMGIWKHFYYNYKNVYCFWDGIELLLSSRLVAVGSVTIYKGGFQAKDISDLRSALRI